MPEAIDIIAEYVNSRLNEDMEFFDEGEPLVEVDGNPLTRSHVDDALVELREQVANE